MGDGFEDLVLVADVVDLLGFDKLDFFHYFCAIILAIVLTFNQFDSAEGSLK